MANSAPQSLGTFGDGGQVQVSYIFDTTSNVVQSLTVQNSGPSGTLHYTITNHSDGSLFVFAGFTNPGQLAAGGGTHTFNVAPANITVTPAGSQKGQVQQLSVDVTASWTSS